MLKCNVKIKTKSHKSTYIYNIREQNKILFYQQVNTKCTYIYEYIFQEKNCIRNKMFPLFADISKLQMNKIYLKQVNRYGRNDSYLDRTQNLYMVPFYVSTVTI